MFVDAVQCDESFLIHHSDKVFEAGAAPCRYSSNDSCSPAAICIVRQDFLLMMWKVNEGGRQGNLSLSLSLSLSLFLFLSLPERTKYKRQNRCPTQSLSHPASPKARNWTLALTSLLLLFPQGDTLYFTRDLLRLFSVLVEMHHRQIILKIISYAL